MLPVREHVGPQRYNKSRCNSVNIVSIADLETFDQRRRVCAKSYQNKNEESPAFSSCASFVAAEMFLSRFTLGRDGPRHAAIIANRSRSRKNS